MAKAPKVESLVDAIAKLERPKRKTWVEKLPADAQREAMEVKAAYLAGRFSVGNIVIAKEMVKRLNLACTADHVSRWLREQE